MAPWRNYYAEVEVCEVVVQAEVQRRSKVEIAPEWLRPTLDVRYDDNQLTYDE